MARESRVSNWSKLAAAGASALVIASALAAHFEGQRLRAYRDIGGVPTICDGDTHNVHMGQVATPQECADRLLEQMKVADAVVTRCYPNIPSPHIRAALDDLAYNEGAGRQDSRPGAKDGKDGVCILHDGRMPTIRRRALAGDWPGVCSGMLAWDKADGQVLRGLQRRRQEEYKLCVMP